MEKNASVIYVTQKKMFSLTEDTPYSTMTPLSPTRREMLKALVASATGAATVGLLPGHLVAESQSALSISGTISKAIQEALQYLGKILNLVGTVTGLVKYIGENWKEILIGAGKAAFMDAYGRILCGMQKKGFTLHLDLSPTLNCSANSNLMGVGSPSGFTFQTLNEISKIVNGRNIRVAEGNLATMIAGHLNKIDYRTAILQLQPKNQEPVRNLMELSGPAFFALQNIGLADQKGEKTDLDFLKTIGFADRRNSEKNNNLFKGAIFNVGSPKNISTGSFNGLLKEASITDDSFTEEFETSDGDRVKVLYGKDKEWKTDVTGRLIEGEGTATITIKRKAALPKTKNYLLTVLQKEGPK